jgi:hypothetical protein
MALWEVCCVSVKEGVSPTAGHRRIRAKVNALFAVSCVSLSSPCILPQNLLLPQRELGLLTAMWSYLAAVLSARNSDQVIKLHSFPAYQHSILILRFTLQTTESTLNFLSQQPNHRQHGSHH